MRRRTIALTLRARQLPLYLVALAAGGGLAVLVASAGAEPPMSAGITAKDPYSFDDGTGHSTVSIARGGSVTFSYPSGASAHNVVFDAAQPACTDMPATASPPGWSGSCTFEAYGTYTFHCGLHSFMTGRVEVRDPNAPPAPGGGELSSPVVKVAGRQRGVVVRGRVTTPDGPSDIAVTAFVAKGALSVSRVRLVKIGSVSKRSTGTGRTSFALRINRPARRALHRRHRLTVSLRIVIAPDVTYAVKKTAAVVLREKP